MLQWQNYSQSYKDRAGLVISEKFIVAVEEALYFIQKNPYACAVYHAGKEYDDLQGYQLRKWNLIEFPYLILFRVDNRIAFIEVIYAHKMDISSRFIKDKK